MQHVISRFGLQNFVYSTLVRCFLSAAVFASAMGTQIPIAAAQQSSAAPDAAQGEAEQQPAAPPPASSSSSNPSTPIAPPTSTLPKGPSPTSLRTGPPQAQRPPALVDPAGPAISLQASEAMFDVAVGLNACGYDAELEASDPIRLHVRDSVNQALQSSEAARTARDQLCAFIAQHRLTGATRELSQYVSLALYLTPPPELATSIDLTEMPPDSTQVVEVLPLLRAFAKAIDLHVLWVGNRPQYDAQLSAVHDPLTRMILTTNVYLKMPANTYDGRRFVVVLEPMLAPGTINARVYGTDYVVVASPVQGIVRMDQVRHTYLHYEIEPLLYSRATALDRELPVLKAVRTAPLEFVYRSDIVALTIECLIRAIEARTMDTGVEIHKVSANVRRADLEREVGERNATEQRSDAVRQKAIETSMSQGFVLTRYFYDTLSGFEHSPASLKEDIGEMVYGMDVDVQVGRAKKIQFAQEGSSDVLGRPRRQLRGLDLAETKLMQGDTASAVALARQSLKDHGPDPGWANFILARCSIETRDIAGAVDQFEEAIKLSKDPRMLAWSHIYLGRIYDINDRRDEAVIEYQAALTVRDGQADTKQAAETGLKRAYAPPKGVEPTEVPNGGEAGSRQQDTDAASPGSGAPAAGRAAQVAPAGSLPLR